MAAREILADARAALCLCCRAVNRPATHYLAILWLGLGFSFGCGGDDTQLGGDAGVDASPVDQGIISTALTVDVTTRASTAVIRIDPFGSATVTFEVGDLAITSVRGDAGDLDYTASGETLTVTLPEASGPVDLTIEYTYSIQSQFEGAMAAGSTLTWPYYCGNLFPCHSDPSDGMTFSLVLTGVPADKTAVYPTAITTDAPAYMLAWSVADYTKLDLGTTAAGTKVAAWYLPGGEMNAIDGTKNLVDVVSWLETTFGPYPFGTEVGSVSVKWGPGAFGGMEHHPLWHVADIAMSDEETQAHEAAHGWYGNGVRIECWEDFVLSEGTVSYLAARALEAVNIQLGATAWTGYEQRLTRLLADTTDNQIAWPDGCGQVDILADNLFNSAPYMKGAFFFLALEKRLGRDVLDGALASFYALRQGKAARMQDLLDHIKAETGYDPNACAIAWLRSKDRPADDTCPAL